MRLLGAIRVVTAGGNVLMTKRANGEGTLSLRPDGRWHVRVVDQSTGVRRSAYFPSEAAARRALRQMATRSEGGQVVLEAGTTLRSYGETWLEMRAGRRRRESTAAAYTYRLRRYVWPRLGGMRLRELTALDVEDMLDELARRGLAMETIKGVRNALAAVLSDAVRGRELTGNVARDAHLPESARRTKEVEPPTVEQVAALLDAVDGTELGPLLILLATTGCRIGEALAMCWADLDLDAGTWRVSRTTTLRRDGSVALGERTKAGDARRIVLDPDAVAALRAQRAQVAEMRLGSPVWIDHDLVFPSSVGTPQHSQNVRALLRPVADRVGFPGSFHALRHFVASVAVSSLPLPVVSKVLGHRRAAMTTDVYGHLLASDAGRMATVVGDALRGARS